MLIIRQRNLFYENYAITELYNFWLTDEPYNHACTVELLPDRNSVEGVVNQTRNWEEDYVRSAST